MSQANIKKPIVTDIFVEGAKKGWVIATTSTVPNVLMAFVIIKALQDHRRAGCHGRHLLPCHGPVSRLSDTRMSTSPL